MPSDPGAAFTFREFKWPSFPSSWHCHPETELTLIARGRGTRFVGDSVDEITDGDVCLLAPNIPHCWVSHEDAETEVQMLTVHLRPESWGEAFWHLRELQSIARMLKEAPGGLSVGGGARREVEQLFQVLRQQPARSLERFDTLLEMLNCISQGTDNRLLRPSAAVRDRRAHSGKLSQILAYIQAHLGPDLTQHEVAEAVRLSPAAFSQFFRRSLGTSYVDYVNELKIRHACHALVDSFSPITEVAFEAGFNNLSHFNAQFRRLRKMSPREYRRQARLAESPLPGSNHDAVGGPVTLPGSGDITVHGKGTSFDGVRVGNEEPRPWLKRYAVCPNLESFGIVHTGLAEIHPPYQIVRKHQTTSYFLACFGGRGRVLVDGRWRTIRPGLACLLPAHAYNAFEVLPDQKWQFGYVCFKQAPEADPKPPAATPVIAEFEVEPLRLAIRGLIAECRGPARPAHVGQWLRLLQTHVDSFTQPFVPDDPLQTLWMRVASRLHEPWSSETLAREAGSTWENLRRLCQKELGRGPLQHLAHLRMHRATELLKTTALTLSAVAQATGYSNPIRFANAFKTTIGCGPSEYRQKTAEQRPGK